MLHIALYQPEIPPNTGNIIRLCANTGAQLHLIHPLGFHPDDRLLQRAGLDYHDWAPIQHHDSYEDFRKALHPRRVFACSTKGTCGYSDASFQDEDVFLFGPETRGLPSEILGSLTPESVLKLPMVQNSRSLNLSNTVAIMVYEAWRQLRFFQ